MKTLKSTLIILIISSLVTNWGYSQSDKSQLRVEFSKADKSKLKKADRYVADAGALMKTGEQELIQLTELREQAASSSDKRERKKLEKKAKKMEKKFLKTQAKASKKFESGNKTIYTIYHNYLKKLKQKADADRRNACLSLQSKAAKNYKKARSKRNKARRTKDVVKSNKELTDANRLEAEAIGFQENAFGIYQGWIPLETEQEEQDDPVVTPIADNSDSGYEADITETSDDDTGFVVEQEVTNNATTSDDLVFKVQIAASKTPLSLEKLLSIYQTDETINNEKEGDWYKYSVGFFKTYEEANQFKQTIGVTDAFVIVYRNQEKISLSETNVDASAYDDTQTYNEPAGDYVYRIQIAASRRPATQTEIKNMYRKNQFINIVQNEGWYKYTIGSFNSEMEAQQYIDNTPNMGEAFVVKYNFKGQEIK